MLGLGKSITKVYFVPGGGFIGLLDESFGQNAVAAYSVRRLSSSAKTAMTIRRDSDGTETDIGFDSDGNLDETAIKAFCTGTTCRVASWKDQSGNDNHAIQSTAANQPTIYTGGAINKLNGKVALKGSATSVQLNISSSLALNSDYGIFSLYTYSGSDMLFGGINPTIGHWNIGGIVQRFDDNTNAVLSTSLSGRVLGYQNRASGTWQISAQGGTLASGTNTANFTLTMLFAGFSGQYDFNGNVQELLFYDTSRLSQRTSIQENIGDYFTQNTPLLDTYTGASAAYSLRLLDSTYTGSAIRVRRASDSAEKDIGFNVFKELDTVSLADFCGSSDGFVTKWFDQSGRKADATQTTAANQPKIYDGTTGVVTENGKPAVQFIYNDSKMFAGSVITDENVTLVGVATKTANGVYGLVSTQPNYNQGYELTEVNGVMSWKIFTSDLNVAASATVQFVTFAYYDGSTQGLSINGSHSSQSSTQSFSLTANLAIGNRLSSGGGQAWSGTIQEMVVYPSSQATNRTNIEDNVNTFYSIY